MLTKFKNSAAIIWARVDALNPRLIYQNFELIQSPSKSPNFEHVWPEICQNPGPRPNSRKTELQTLLNPGSFTKTQLQTHPNPPKIQNSKPMNWVIKPNTSCLITPKALCWTVKLPQIALFSDSRALWHDLSLDPS